MLLGAAFPLATAALFAYVGGLTRHRHVMAADRPASLAFATWWYGAAAVLSLNGGQTLLALVGVKDVALYLTLIFAQALPLAAALAGLLIYLAYLYFGHFRAVAPIAAFYVLFLSYTLYYFSSLGPWTLHQSEWDSRLLSGNSRPDAAFYTFIVLLTVPVIVAAVAYASLYARSPERTQRFRIALVSLAFLLWFGAMAVGFIAVPPQTSWYPLVYQAPGLFASLLILLAFRPPSWVQRRYHVAAVA